MLEKLRTAYDNYLYVKLITVTIVVFLSVGIMLPLIKIAELFGINIRGNTGLNFDVSFGNAFFLLFSKSQNFQLLKKFRFF